ncbi:Arm DNA-binding domain-containing protein [Paraburkholderia strydomiana]|uniref:Arm DNA-binding domain-containing protein n=1 Tax=Paraburkholderia strydomiana TaxID=1245417 RepID=UPI001BE7300D|nr:Arm DNA-binding domain-containing protein [Paraburkholderia strydomiana]MBT2793823.1 hypothetical protein [Paraburkholderia strydomiana]
MQLSGQQLRDLTAADSGRKLHDSENSSGKVRLGVDGRISVSSRYRLRCEGVEDEAALGTWPKVSLKDLRIRLIDVKAPIEAGINPSAQKVTRPSACSWRRSRPNAIRARSGTIGA